MRIEEFSGSARERGLQHGERLGAAARETGVMDFFRDYLEREVLGGPIPVASSVLDALHRRFAGNLSPDARDLVAGFCRSAALDERDTLKALVMPDAINYLIGAAGRAAGVPTLGCTTVAAWGDYSEGGRFLYGRNLDFIGNGLWDKHQLIARHRPDKGIPFVSLSSAGCVLDGITGLNEEGLTVDLHQHVNTDLGWPGGRPILDLGLEVLQRARTIEDAISLVERNPTTSGWSLVVTHWKERKAAVLERTPRRMSVQRHDDGHFAFTNTYRGETLRARELDAPAFRESSRLREKRAWQILEENKGKIGPATIAALLGDHLDCERGKTRVFAQCIAYPNNLTSVVMEPEKGIMWVAEGPAPMCDSSYKRVLIWSGGACGERLPDLRAVDSSVGKGMNGYVRAVKAWQLERDHVSAAKALGEAAAAVPEDPALRLMHGLFLLKSGEHQAAADAFEAGAAQPDLPHRAASQRYWRGRALDLLGKRGEAIVEYKQAAKEAAFRPLRVAAETGVSRARKHGRILPDLAHADAHGY